MEDRIPRITRCKLCRYYKPARFGMMCALHLHGASDRDGCTWGAEEPDPEGESAPNLSQM